MQGQGPCQEKRKMKKKKKFTPKTNPSILCTKPTLSPNPVNSTWISKSTALQFSSAIVTEGHGSAQRNSCQLHSAPRELLWAHRRSLGLWEPRLLEVFPQHLLTSSLRTAVLDASKHCFGGFLQRKKEEKKFPLCMHVHPREWERLFASTHGAKCPEVNGNTLWLAMSSRHAFKEKQRAEESQGRDAVWSQHRPGGYVARQGALSLCCW